MNYKKNIGNKGFTLIELIVTIALLAVIAIISFVSINEVIKQSKVNDCENLESSIMSAAKEYVSDNRYSSSFDSDGNKKVEITVKTLLDEHYLSDSIVNPFDSSDVIDGDKIKILIELKNDYSAKNVYVYKNSISDSNKYSCDESWWNFG